MKLRARAVGADPIKMKLYVSCTHTPYSKYRVSRREPRVWGERARGGHGNTAVGVAPTLSARPRVGASTDSASAAVACGKAAKAAVGPGVHLHHVGRWW